MCKDTGISPGAITDLKMGRRSSLSAANLSRLSAYFHVTVDCLLGTEKEPAGRLAAAPYILLLESRPELTELLDSVKDFESETIRSISVAIKKLTGPDR